MINSVLFTVVLEDASIIKVANKKGGKIKPAVEDTLVNKVVKKKRRKTKILTLSGLKFLQKRKLLEKTAAETCTPVDIKVEEDCVINNNINKNTVGKSRRKVVLKKIKVPTASADEGVKEGNDLVSQIKNAVTALKNDKQSPIEVQVC